MKFLKKIVAVICITATATASAQTGDEKFFSREDSLSMKLRSSEAFGTVLGNFNGAVVYSNGSTGYNSGVYNFETGINTGLKFQCVEYVNRYFKIVYALDLKSTGIYGNANSYYSNAAAGGLTAFANGGATKPAVGDLICSNGGEFGHVAIVREVGAGYVKCVMQNWSNTPLDNSMQLAMTTTGGNYSVAGFSASYPIAGWLRKNQLPAPTILTPAQNASVNATPVTITWQPVGGAGVYGLKISATPDFLTTELRDEDISAGVTTYSANLTSGLKYAQMRTLNSAGTTWGPWSATRVFAVAAPAQQAPSVMTGAATVTSNSAVITALINPNASTTSAYLQIGLTPTNLASVGTVQNLGSGNAAVVCSFNALGLLFNTQYFYRVVGFNAAGNSYGTVQSFTTTQEQQSAYLFDEGFEGTIQGIVPNFSWQGNATPTTLPVFAGAKAMTFTLGSGAANRFQLYKFAAPQPTLSCEFAVFFPMAYAQLQQNVDIFIARSNSTSTNLDFGNWPYYVTVSPASPDSVDLKMTVSHSGVLTTLSPFRVKKGVFITPKIEYRASPMQVTFRIGDAQRVFNASSAGPSIADCLLGAANNSGEPAGISITFDALKIRSGNTSGVKQIAPTAKVFGLEQNYPNPFNPQTTIRFTLAARSAISLKVYDTLGREVETLTSGVKERGTYEAQFDASRLSSGTYFYKLQADGFVETKKMILVK